MKKIEAIIVPAKLNAVRAELETARDKRNAVID